MRRIRVGTTSITESTVDLVNQVLETKRLSYGPLCREFETRVATLHGCKYGVLSNSGTSSLQVALQAMKEFHGWRDGDEVIVPALTFVATANIVLHNNLKPVFVDIDPSTYNMMPGEMFDAFSERTRCVIPVHLFGQMANMELISDLVRTWSDASGNDVKIIQDSCECMFATNQGNTPGYYGDIVCFSTYVAHLITTGVGGVSATNDAVYAAKMRSLVNHGRDGVYISIDDGVNKEVMERRFRFESVGHSFRVTELEAAIGLPQLDTWPKMISKRRKNAQFLTNNLCDIPGIQVPTIGKGNTHSFMMYPILYDGDKWDLCNYLEDNGIETREMLPLTNQPIYAGMINESDYPNAKMVNEHGFYIGCHQGVDAKDLQYIVDTFSAYAKEK